MSTLKVDTILKRTGTGTITVGQSGDTISIPSGATLSVAGSNYAAGITVADQWRLTSDLAYSTANTAQLVSANLERVDSAWNGTIGTAMSVSSGIWTFPQTGVYKVEAVYNMFRDNHLNEYAGGQIQATTNNSSYSVATFKWQSFADTAGLNASVYMSVLIDVDDVDNDKVKFMLYGSDSGGFSVRGNTSDNSTYFTFIRLGDT